MSFPDDAGFFVVGIVSSMRFARIATKESMSFSTVDGEGHNLKFRAIAGHPFEEPEHTGKEFSPDEVKLLSPMLPSKIVLIADNFGDGEPNFLLKPPTSVIGPGAPIRIPAAAMGVAFEGQLALVIGKPCKDVAAADWRSAVLGATILNDVSAIGLDTPGEQAVRARAFDTFCPVGPWVDTDIDALNVEDTDVIGRVTRGDETTTYESAATKDMVWSFPEIIEYVSHTMTLLPGDIIATGLPVKKHELASGDTVTIAVDGLGQLRNRVH